MAALSATASVEAIADLSERFNVLSTNQGINSNNHCLDGYAPHRKLEWGPIEHLAHYSCDNEDNISFDLKCLRTFRQPSIPSSLLKGREEFHQRNKYNRSIGHPLPLDNLAHACIALGQEDKLRSADVVTWRGVLVKLMLGDRIDLEFFAVDGVLYLLEHDQRPYATHKKQLYHGYHGYAFEALCTASTDADAIPKLDAWRCIVRRSFGHLAIVFGGEVDCVSEQYDKTSANFMELKTECIVAEGTPARNDHKKKKKWYLQSYLMGIPQITVGYRDDKFVLRKVDSVPLAQLYRPPDNTLENAFTYAFETLQQLRNFCSTQRDKPGSRAWKVTVRRGALLDNPHQL